MATSRCLVAVLVLTVVGCTAPPLPTMAQKTPLMVSALTPHRLGCTEVDAYSGTCIGN